MRHIQRTLDDCASRAVGQIDLWPKIERKVLRQSSQALGKPASRLGWVALAVSLLVVASTAVYAAGPILKGVYRINPTWDPAAADASHPVNLSQTVDDCTVTVEQVYAYSERILIGITVDGPAGMSRVPVHMCLTTEEGIRLPWIDGAGDAPEQWVLAFDATSLGDLPSELRLHLSLEISAISVDEAASPTAAPADAAGDGGVVAVELSPIETTVYGPFTFEFTIPVSTSSAD